MRRSGPDVLLAVALPVVSALVLVLLVGPDRDQPGAQPPTESRLTTASVICPPALGDDAAQDQVGVATLAGEGTSGQVSVGLGATTAPLDLTSDRTSRPTDAGAGPLVVDGEDDLAPGLVASRVRTSPLAATDCAPPQPEQWFTAVGADATHDSVVQLTNPNPGPAIADITVRGPSGELDVPQLRGVTVAGGTTSSIDLGAVVPRRGELSLEVVTSRGRLGVQVVDSVDALGSGPSSQDWLASQPAPSTSNLLLGLAPGTGERTLVLANPGDDEVRADVKVVTPDATFAPSGVDTVRIAPGSTEAVSLDDVLAQAVTDGATGVLVESDGAVTASLRQLVDDDLSVLTPAPALSQATGVLVPPGQQRLLLAGSTDVGVATWAAYDADGTQLDTQRVELSAGTGADVALPQGTSLLTFTPERAATRATVVATGRGRATGLAVVPLRELVLTSLVPQVRPGTP